MLKYGLRIFFFFYIGLIWFFSKIVIIDKRYYKDGKILHETKWFSKGLIKKNVWKKKDWEKQRGDKQWEIVKKYERLTAASISAKNNIIRFCGYEQVFEYSYFFSSI